MGGSVDPMEAVPRRVQTWRLLSLRQTSPEQLFLRKVALKEYGDALLWAAHVRVPCHVAPPGSRLLGGTSGSLALCLLLCFPMRCCAFPLANPDGGSPLRCVCLPCLPWPPLQTEPSVADSGIDTCAPAVRHVD